MARAEALVVRPLPYLFLIVSIALAGCAPTTVDPAAGYSLELHESGGFAGGDETTTIRSSDGSIAFHSDKAKLEKATLTAAELDSLGKLLENTDVGGGPYRCDECSDEVNFELTVTSGSSANNVQWDDSDGAPPDVTALGRYVDKLGGEHFANDR
jgi:hypothetical protein